MKISAREKRLVEANRATVLEEVKKYEDITFGHITMCEDILKALGLDHEVVMDTAIAIKKAQIK